MRSNSLGLGDSASCGRLNDSAVAVVGLWVLRLRVRVVEMRLWGLYG